MNFSEPNIESLTESVTKLKEVLSEIGTSLWHQNLNNILDSAIRKDNENFKKNVLKNEFFGGSGALWELYCGNDKLQSEFQAKFNLFCVDLLKIGINNARIKQVTERF